jgi:D-amino-acid dehydrogenase
MIGQAGAENLFVNAGHGSLGWTLAFGSAEALLQSIKEHYP